MPTPPTPQVAIVVPTYNVAAYLPAFLDSLTRQTLPLDRLELVFVDDGSTDGSGDLIRSWSAEHAPHAAILTQPNGGLAAARNAGLALASAEWVNFCDPDDVFDKHYFRVVSDFLDSPDAARVQLVATRLLILDDATGTVSDTHPLAFKFHHGARVVDLTDDPRWIHMQAASSFLRRGRIEELGLRFDDDVRPNFEDTFLITRYLAAHRRPAIAVLPRAEYHYRRRSDGSSLVQSSWSKHAKYTVLPEVGYLRLLDAVRAQRGEIPVWAQHVVLYDLLFYFRHDSRNHSPTHALPPEVSAQFLDLVRRIVALLDAHVIFGFDVYEPRAELLAVLAQGLGDAQTPFALRGPRDPEQRLERVRYYVRGTPTESLTLGGAPVAPLHAKYRSLDHFGAVLLSERIAWVPSPEPGLPLTVTVDGREIPVRSSREPGPPRPREPVGRVQRLRTLAGHVKERVGEDPQLLRQRREDLLVRARARTRGARARFADAWLLIDRDTAAQDNAEHLYRHLRVHQPDVNAWFVLRRDSADWNRLQAEGFRLVEHGSTEFWTAVELCAHIVSSQIDHYVAAPTAGRRLRKDGWRLTFLQHGVTKDDLSRWINRKPIDLMVTVTPDEQASIVADGTPYVLTTREARMTGFPRHDRLLELGQRHTDDRDLLLVMPTWRRELLGEELAGGNDRALVDGFWQTEYARQWRAVLESPALHAAADAAGVHVTFVPHPNMQDYLDDSPLPPHIRVHRFRDVDIQDVLARAAALVTDYSSMAFEAAYLERPVVYFQFDAAQFFAGGHAYRQGTWSYRDSGFGPVADDADQAVAALVDLAGRGFAPAEPYAARMRHTFPLRDGQCCARTAAAIRALRQPVTAVAPPHGAGPCIPH